MPVPSSMPMSVACAEHLDVPVVGRVQPGIERDSALHRLEAADGLAEEHDGTR